MDRVLIRGYEKALENEAVPTGRFFLIATPAHEADYLALKTILTSDWKPRYVGLLSSRAKAAKFVSDLEADLGSDVDLSALFTPVGLDIGGSAAHEIALSVLAEIQALRYGRLENKHLKTSEVR